MPIAEHSLSAATAALRPQPAPVTRGVRLASFRSVQGMIADEHERALLRDMSTAIHALAEQDADPTALVLLTGVYHDLLRKWAEV